MSVVEPSLPARPTRIRWAVFSLAFGTSVLLYLHRYVFAFIKPMLQERWDLSNEQLGDLDTAFSIPYTVAQFPLAIAADAFGVRLVLTGLMLIWCSGLALTAWASVPIQVAYAQGLLGTGQSAVFACLCRIGRHWYPPALRTTLQGTVGVLAGRLGGLCSGLVFGTVMLGVCGLDWQTATWILVGVGIANALLFLLVFRDSPASHPAVNPAEVRLIEGAPTAPVATSNGAKQADDQMTVAAMLRSMTPRSLLNLAFLCLQSLLSTFADNIYSNWIPLFLWKVHELKFKEMGIYSALPLLGGAIAGLIGGALNDYLIAVTGNRRWSRTAVGLVGKGMAAVLMFAAITMYDDPYWFCAMLFFVKLFGDWSLTTAWGVVTDIGGRATASVFAFNNSVASLSIVVAPKLFGYIADHHGWRTVFLIVGVTYALCALSWLFIDSTIPVIRDTSGESNDKGRNSNV